MRRVSISFKSAEAAAELLRDMAERVEKEGSAQEVFDTESGPEFGLEVVDEGSDEFATPVVAFLGEA